MNPLHLRLAELRRHLWLVVTVRGICWLFAVLLTALVVAGWLDWRLQLPAFPRAVTLVGALVGLSVVAWRSLLGPLLTRSDDLTLALQVEARHPELHDCLGSAVQFLDQAGDLSNVPTTHWRKRSIQQALDAVAEVDFHEVVDTRGVQAAGFSFLGAAFVALLCVLLSPQLAWTALVRLADPFGRHEWPRETQLTLKARTRVARGEPFDVQVTLSGYLPEKATIHYRWSDSSVYQQGYDLKPATGQRAIEFTARLEGGRVQRNFQYQVVAHDATSGWREVAVLPPPQLVPLEGRPSPQIHLDFPAYTDLPAQDLPDGTSSIDAVAGTQIRLRGATDRPIARATLLPPPEALGGLGLMAWLNPIGQVQPLTVAGDLIVARSNAWQRLPARIDETGQILELDWIARYSGLFVLIVEDETELASTRLVEVRVWGDPTPTVHLERPSRSQDSLDVLPQAELTLRTIAEDPQYALRSVILTHRRKRGDGQALQVGQLPLYQHAALENALPQMLPGIHPRLPAHHLRPAQVTVERRWSLAPLQLKEGDVLILQALADDFDDVTAGKAPGRSHELELRIISPATLEVSLNEAQSKVQQELLRLRKEQQEALDKVANAEQHQGKLQPRHFDDLLQAEQMQQQIKARVGTKDEGLRADVNRILQTLKDNRMPRSSTQDRAETIANELDRLAREHLDAVESKLRNVRKEQEQAEAKSATPELREARTHQEEVRNTLNDLLKLLEPWSSTQEIKGEARQVLQEQRRLAEETARLNDEKKIPPGRDRQQLTPEQNAALDRARDQQNKVAERVDQLLNQMRNVARDRQEKDPASAESLKHATEQAEENDLVGQMRRAAENFERNQVSRAGAEQRNSQQTLEKMVKTLEERREAELDRLSKKLREAEKKMANLIQQQEDLQKKRKEAEGLTDPAQKEAELKRLAREQEQLQRETQEMVRELTRMRAERSAQALSQASSRMAQAGQQMQRGEDADQQQEEALDRLDDAQRELEQARENVDEELTREKRARLADEITGLRERQEALRAESERIHGAVLQARRWTRPLQSTLSGLEKAQRDLAEETTRLGEQKLADTKVLLHLLKKATERMQDASERMEQRLNEARDRQDQQPEGSDGAFDKDALTAETTADAEMQGFQREALMRIDQILQTLKPSDQRAGGPQQPQEEGDQPPGGGGAGASGSDGVSSLAELKLLKTLQQEVAERTTRFHKEHPQPVRFGDKDKETLRVLQQEQQELTDLFDQLTAPAAQEEEP